MRRKKKKKKENQEAAFTSGLGPRPRLTPIDVQQKEFRLAFRGYNERDVDEFLDLVTEELAAYVEENRRLQDQDGMAGFTSPSGGIETHVSREAEEILARARAKAAAIVRDAEERAAAIIGPAAAGTGDHRAMIGPFLSREREFLQSLGQLVQEHAETVRRMVKVAKNRAASAEPAATEALDGAEEPEVIPIEPAQSTAGMASEPRPEGQGSVRELFWGEE